MRNRPAQLALYTLFVIQSAVIVLLLMPATRTLLVTVGSMLLLGFVLIAGLAILQCPAYWIVAGKKPGGKAAANAANGNNPSRKGAS